MPNLLFTGFPGFLGSELLPKVLGRLPEHRAFCLVQSKFMGQAEARLESILKAFPTLRGRIALAIGDITQPDLGLENAPRIQRETSEIFHLAAVYDLSARRDLAMQVNVNGTRNVLDFAEGVSNLRRLHYVSTCYVSGRYAGPFSEEDLEKGQAFNNAYEETKYLAEVEVRARMRGGLPATIYRPAIVVGDSRTGATQKYDGPYYVIRWLLRQPVIAVLPEVGSPTVARLNVVPRDYVVDAISYLSGLDASLGKVYQLADPEPLTVRELIKLVGRAARRIVVRIPLPMALAKLAIDRLPGVYWLMQIPSAIIDYSAHATLYTSANTVADLEGSGLRVPPLPTYIDRIVDFVRRHPRVGSSPMA
jgi:thioester reductase-like protein